MISVMEEKQLKRMEGLGMDNQITQEDLRYAAYARCRCGSGLAYIKDLPLTDDMGSAWYCSAALLKFHTHKIDCIKPGGLFGGGILRDEDGIEHDQSYPFVTYEIKSEDQPSANGTTTRPKG
jgi:hypothetical protein